MTCSVSVVLPRRLRAVDLDDAAARQAADAERDVEAERAGGDDLDVVGSTSPSPRRMIEPLPNCFSICASAACRALAFSGFMLDLAGVHGAVSGGCDGDYLRKLDVCTVVVRIVAHRLK